MSDATLPPASNAPFLHWGEVIVDPAMTLVTVDRLVHHSTILEMNVESYRCPFGERRANILTTGRTPGDGKRRGN